MKLYADTPVRRSRQLLADVLVVAWIVGWVWVALIVHDGTMALAAPGRQVESSAVGMADGLAEAGDFLDRVPVVGDGVSAPFDKASSASESLAEAGRSQVRAVERLAFWLGLSVALIPILVVLAFFLPLRLRFVREATAGARFIDASEDLDLFALRALSRQPMHLLARISDDPAGAWRRGDAAVVRALADLELRDSGLRAPNRALLQGDAG
jgi:hypothetical protein